MRLYRTDEILHREFPFTDDKRLRDIYMSYFPRLLRFAIEYVDTKEDAENIIQDIFTYILENRHTICINTTLNAWLYAIVRNKCIDFLRHRLAVEEGNRHLQDSFVLEQKIKLQSLQFFDDELTEDTDATIQAIYDAIESLPERCRRIFKMNKLEGKKYSRIAEELGISEKTVENQMGTALAKLREKLKRRPPK